MHEPAGDASGAGVGVGAGASVDAGVGAGGGGPAGVGGGEADVCSSGLGAGAKGGGGRGTEGGDSWRARGVAHVTVTAIELPVRRNSEHVGVRRHQPLAHSETYAQDEVSSQSVRQPCAGSKPLKRSGSSAQ